MADLIYKEALIEELHHMVYDDAETMHDYEYLGIDDCIRSMPTTTEAEIRSKAIDEFAERLKEKYPYLVEDVGFVEGNKMLHNKIDKITKEMRRGEQ